MISLGRLFSDEPRRDDTEPLRRAIRLLVQGIEVHTLTFNEEDYAWFRSSLVSAQRHLEGVADGELSAVGETIQILAEYNRRTSSHIRIRLEEMHGIISTLIGAVEHMVSANDSSVHNLKQIQSQLAAAAKGDDLRTLKSNLFGCLKQITDEVEAQKQASAAGKTALAAREGVQPQIHRGHQELAPDPLTGLPGREEAEASLAEVAQATSLGAVAVFVLPRLLQVNLRFGRATGDRLLELLSTYLGSGLHSSDQLFRWTGPALVAVIHRGKPLESIRLEIGKLVAGLAEPEIRIGERLAIIPFSVDWTLFPISRPLDTTIQRIEAFAARQAEAN